MTTQAMNIIRIGLDMNQLDDQGLEDLATAILQNAPQGTLYAANKSIQDCVTALGDSNSKFKTASTLVIADEAKLVTDKQAQADARAVLVTNLVQLRGLVETTAKTAADVKGTGYLPLEKAAPGALVIPSGVDIFYPKDGHNRAKVSAQQTGTTRSRYAAQLCPDPLAQNTWTDLKDDGRSHWLTGYKTGPVLWVRFRSVRGHERSDWCAPVSVTIP